MCFESQVSSPNIFLWHNKLFGLPNHANAWTHYLANHKQLSCHRLKRAISSEANVTFMERTSSLFFPCASMQLSELGPAEPESVSS